MKKYEKELKQTRIIQEDFEKDVIKQLVRYIEEKKELCYLEIVQYYKH